MEVDFGESWALIGGRIQKVRFFVATLPYSNVYWAKAYAVEHGDHRFRRIVIGHFGRS